MLLLELDVGICIMLLFMVFLFMLLLLMVLLISATSTLLLFICPPTGAVLLFIPIPPRRALLFIGIAPPPVILLNNGVDDAFALQLLFIFTIEPVDSKPDMEAGVAVVDELLVIELLAIEMLEATEELLEEEGKKSRLVEAGSRRFTRCCGVVVE